jgi:hypothetical protein
MAQQLGRGVIKINGTPIGNDIDFTLDFGGVKRTEKTNASTSVNYTEATAASKLDFNMPVASGVSVSYLQTLTAATVTVEADTGQTWTIPNAWNGDPQAVSGSAGTAKITLMGDAVQETT